jgi:hypothetical protein
MITVLFTVILVKLDDGINWFFSILQDNVEYYEYRKLSQLPLGFSIPWICNVLDNIKMSAQVMALFIVGILLLGITSAYITSCI